MTTDEIRKVVQAIRDGDVTFKGSHYTQAIDPYWLATPERRRALWDTIARIVALDETYGEQPFASDFGKRGLD